MSRRESRGNSNRSQRPKTNRSNLPDLPEINAFTRHAVLFAKCLERFNFHFRVLASLVSHPTNGVGEMMVRENEVAKAFRVLVSEMNFYLEATLGQEHLDDDAYRRSLELWAEGGLKPPIENLTAFLQAENKWRSDQQDTLAQAEAMS